MKESITRAVGYVLTDVLHVSRSDARHCNSTGSILRLANWRTYGTKQYVPRHNSTVTHAVTN